MRLAPQTTPWSSAREYTQVYHQLFSPVQSEREKALSRIALWKERTDLPVAIESTYQFIDAIQYDPDFVFDDYMPPHRDANVPHHEDDGDGNDSSGSGSVQDSSQATDNALDMDFQWIISLSPEISHTAPCALISPHSLRMLYGLAMVRFVNGLIDSKQTKMFAQSMTKLAEQLGLPRFFVDLRHEVTHDRLPSLPCLRFAIMEALLWLHENFWIGSIKTTQDTSHARLESAIAKYASAMLDLEGQSGNDHYAKWAESIVSDFYQVFESAPFATCVQKNVLSCIYHHSVQLFLLGQDEDQISTLWIPLLSVMMAHSTPFMAQLAEYTFGYLDANYPEYSYSMAQQQTSLTFTKYFKELETKNQIIKVIYDIFLKLLKEYTAMAKDKSYSAHVARLILKQCFMHVHSRSLEIIHFLTSASIVTLTSKQRSVLGLMKHMLHLDADASFLPKEETIENIQRDIDAYRTLLGVTLKG